MALSDLTSIRSFRRSAQLLTADGELASLDVATQALEGRVIAIVRERCIFGEFDAPPAANTRTAVAAARLHARTTAPFRNSGWVLTRQGRAFGIWWWDMEWVGPALEAQGIKPGTVKLLPEPFFRMAGNGARIVRTAAGYEAQLWHAGFLIADSWRRSPFDNDAWLNFYRLHSAEDTQPNAPPVEAAPFVSRSTYRSTLVSDLSIESAGQLAAVVFATVLAMATAYFLGQAYQFDRSADRTLEEASAAQARSNTRHDAEVQSQLRNLVTLKTYVDQPDPLTLLRAAQQIVQPFGYKISTFSVNRDRVQFSLPEEAAVGVDLIATELAASPYFQNVRPRLEKDKKRLQIEMAIRHHR